MKSVLVAGKYRNHKSPRSNSVDHRQCEAKLRLIKSHNLVSVGHWNPETSLSTCFKCNFREFSAQILGMLYSKAISFDALSAMSENS